MINSVYKKMGNLRKRINVRLVNKAENFLKYTSRPTYITHKTFIVTIMLLFMKLNQL